MDTMTTSPKIAIIGLGYVGLPLAIAFGQKYATVGFDTHTRRVDELKEGKDHTLQSSSEAILNASQLSFSDQLSAIKDCNIYIVTVPTPVTPSKEPDLSFLLNATASIGTILKKGDIVIYESTVYPGCTEEDCVPVLEKTSGLKYNEDFYCGYSPERINPGDTMHTLTTIQKITSGSTPVVADTIDALYQSIITAGTYKVSSIKVAEAAKSIENAQRDINISFVNELALIFDKMNIDTTEVLEAAATKWNFLPFRPGLAGGHCISVDPYYLLNSIKQIGGKAFIVEEARRVNEGMVDRVASQVIQHLQSKAEGVSKKRVLIVGASFKPNVRDVRNSKPVELAKLLIKENIEVDITNVKVNENLRVEDVNAENMEVMNSPRIPIASVVMTRQLKQEEAAATKK